MKLKSVHLRNFRNILDSTEARIHPEVTCLVGKNEAGKTAFLEAHRRLDPAQPNAKFNAARQYPAWLEKKHRMQGVNIDASTPVTGVYTVEDADREAFEKRFGKGVLKTTEIE